MRVSKKLKLKYDEVYTLIAIYEALNEGET